LGPDWASLVLPGAARICLLVLDGIGDTPRPEVGGITPLEAARTPHLDRLAREGVGGLVWPVVPGATPSSVSGHLGLLGYDPLETEIGRGAVEALGVGLDLREGEVAARANFATLSDGVVADRRAGRMPTEKTAELCQLINRETGMVDGVEVILYPVRQHRAVAVFRGEGLDPSLSDTDPGRTGEPPRPAQPLSPEAERTARLVNAYLSRVAELLRGRHPANCLLLRGFAGKPRIRPFGERFGLRGAALASYPAYRGIARALGLEVPEEPGDLRGCFEAYRRRKKDYDFFFIHYKDPDPAGEDGDFQAKVRAIERLDHALPLLLEDPPEVLAVTGDHSTPCSLRAHSWHPVPVIIHSPATWGPDAVSRFTERECARGILGRLRGVELLPLLLASSGRTRKFGT